jgi:hypothetical protein
MDTPSAEVVLLQGGETVPDLRWGTHPPVVYDAPGTGVLRLRAHGHCSVQLRDAPLLRTALALPDGGWPADLDGLRRHLSELIAAGLDTLLQLEPLPLAALAQQRQPLADRLRQQLAPAAASLGLTLPALSLEGFGPSESVQPQALPLHVLRGDQPSGPLTLSEVAQLRWRGDLGPDTLVWHPNLVDWQAAASLPELAPLFRLPPPPPPLPA